MNRVEFTRNNKTHPNISITSIIIIMSSHEEDQSLPPDPCGGGGGGGGGDDMPHATSSRDAVEAVPEVDTTTPITTTTCDVGMSKNRKKRLAKEQRIRENKIFKKQRAREQRAEQKAQKKAALQALWESMTPEEIEKDKEARHARVRELRQSVKDRKARLVKGLEEGQRIVIDFDFKQYMHEGEIRSIVQQTNYTYGMNGRAQYPCHLILTSITGAMKEAFDKQIPSRHSWIVTETPQSYSEMFEKEKDKLIYLTAEAEDEIQVLEKDKIYVVGGIVDKNRHKGLCYARAKEQGIATARLPIEEYVNQTRSCVMCTNHVVEMLIKWQETKDWKQAFDAVVPQRKRMLP